MLRKEDYVKFLRELNKIMIADVPQHKMLADLKAVCSETDLANVTGFAAMTIDCDQDSVQIDDAENKS